MLPLPKQPQQGHDRRHGGGGGYFKNQNWRPKGICIQNLSFLALKLRLQTSSISIIQLRDRQKETY